MVPVPGILGIRLIQFNSSAIAILDGWAIRDLFRPVPARLGLYGRPRSQVVYVPPRSFDQVVMAPYTVTHESFHGDRTLFVQRPCAAV